MFTYDRIIIGGVEYPRPKRDPEELERLREILHRPIVVTLHAGFELEWIEPWAVDPADLGRWEGEGGASAVEACGAREPALGCGPACTEPATHRGPHVARDPGTRRMLALWPRPGSRGSAGAPASSGCAS